MPKNRCRICSNEEGNKAFEVPEMQHGMGELFSYFQCKECFCIQIAEIPENIARYYPQDYYSFNSEEGNHYLEAGPGYFKKVQSDYLIHQKKPVLGSLFSIGYKPPRVIGWLREMGLPKTASILDIGSGSGLNLKMMHHLGYKNLTGVDPFIKQDFQYTEQFSVLKKDPLELDENKKFDCVMMHHSFEHMVFEREVLLKVKRLLKPQGKLLIRIPIYSKPLFEKYGPHLVSLDAPRHLYVHSTKSMELLCKEAGLKISHIEYDADISSFWASEQYQRGISLFAPNSYGVSRTDAPFSQQQIRQFKKDIQSLNEQGESDTAAFYIS